MRALHSCIRFLSVLLHFMVKEGFAQWMEGVKGSLKGYIY